MCGRFHIKLNIGARPIANKYREGKMKRTLERELKVPEIAERKALKTIMHPKKERWARGNAAGTIHTNVWCVICGWNCPALFCISLGWLASVEEEGNWGKKVTLQMEVAFIGFPRCDFSTRLRIMTFRAGLGYTCEHSGSRMLIQKVLNDPSWNTDQGV